MAGKTRPALIVEGRRLAGRRWMPNVVPAASCYEPVLVCGLDQSIRIEMFADLNKYGTLGRTVLKSEALADSGRYIAGDSAQGTDQQ